MQTYAASLRMPSFTDTSNGYLVSVPYATKGQVHQAGGRWLFYGTFCKHLEGRMDHPTICAVIVAHHPPTPHSNHTHHTTTTHTSHKTCLQQNHLPFCTKASISAQRCAGRKSAWLAKSNSHVHASGDILSHSFN